MPGKGRGKGRGGGSAFGEYQRQARVASRWAQQQAARRNREEAERLERREGGSTWTPAGSQNPDVGTLEGTDHVVSFKTGGRNGDETLIRDGDYSDDKAGFDGPRDNPQHDHYGSAREGGWIDQIRGFFSG